MRKAGARGGAELRWALSCVSGRGRADTPHVVMHTIREAGTTAAQCDPLRIGTSRPRPLQLYPPIDAVCERALTVWGCGLLGYCQPNSDRNPVGGRRVARRGAPWHAWWREALIRLPSLHSSHRTRAVPSHWGMCSHGCQQVPRVNRWPPARYRVLRSCAPSAPPQAAPAPRGSPPRRSSPQHVLPFPAAPRSRASASSR